VRDEEFVCFFGYVCVVCIARKDVLVFVTRLFFAMGSVEIARAATSLGVFLFFLFIL